MAARLRAPDGCPWDRGQSHSSLRPSLIEEAFEVAEAIDSGDMAELLAELGDLLFQVVIHAQLASESGAFDLAAVATIAADKLIRRHPHVFAGTVIPGGDLLAQWERIKRDERRDDGSGRSVLDGVPRSLPALFAAERLLERAARVHVNPPRIDLALDVDEETLLGDLLFDVVADAREKGFDAERALRGANARFSERVRLLEQVAREAGRAVESYGEDELAALWSGTA
ncbi:MAG: YabN family protein [Candidatus Limnocylindria bacterium]